MLVITIRHYCPTHFLRAGPFAKLSAATRDQLRSYLYAALDELRAADGDGGDPSNPPSGGSVVVRGDERGWTPEYAVRP